MALRLALSRLEDEELDIEDLQLAILHVMRNSTPRISQRQASLRLHLPYSDIRRILKSRDTSLEELTTTSDNLDLRRQRIMELARQNRNRRLAILALGDPA